MTDSERDQADKEIAELTSRKSSATTPGEAAKELNDQVKELVKETAPVTTNNNNAPQPPPSSPIPQTVKPVVSIAPAPMPTQTPASTSIAAAHRGQKRKRDDLEEEQDAKTTGTTTTSTQLEEDDEDRAFKIHTTRLLDEDVPRGLISTKPGRSFGSGGGSPQIRFWSRGEASLSMNEIFGPYGWNNKIVKIDETEDGDITTTMRVNIIGHRGNVLTSREDVGSARREMRAAIGGAPMISHGRKDEPTERKASVSDAFKRVVMLLGRRMGESFNTRDEERRMNEIVEQILASSFEQELAGMRSKLTMGQQQQQRRPQQQYGAQQNMPPPPPTLTAPPLPQVPAITARSSFMEDD